MCDEYDDERMRAFGRQLAMREDPADLRQALESVGEALAKPADEIVPPESRKARALLR